MRESMVPPISNIDETKLFPSQVVPEAHREVCMGMLEVNADRGPRVVPVHCAVHAGLVHLVVLYLPGLYKSRLEMMVCVTDYWRPEKVYVWYSSSLNLKRRRWNWLGHVLRMKKTRHPHRALHWTPMGKRKRGRPRGTYTRTIEVQGRPGESWLGWHRFHLVDALSHSNKIGQF